MMEMSCIIDRKTGKNTCPLLSVEAGAVIGDGLAEVTVTQNYINSTGGNIEALYTFPLPHKAQVSGFNAKIGEVEVEGGVMEKEEAFMEYDHAVRRGDSAVLLESYRPDIFQVSLGNIARGEKASVTISYLEEIECIDNELRWVLPTVIAPRFIPGIDTGKKTGPGMANPTDKVPDADYITPVIGDAPYTLKLNVQLTSQMGIRKVSSPSHPVEVTMDRDKAVVRLAREDELLDSDFILKVCFEKERKSNFIKVHSEDKGNFGQLLLIPEIDDISEAVGNYEYNFLIDVSGSMEGEKLSQAKRALSIALRNLMDGDYFNIIAFESGFHCFSSVPVPYSQKNLDKADAFINSLHSMGGTEIYKPISYLMETMQPSESDRRILLLFTDGEVGNEQEVINLVRRNNKSWILYPFGIDTAVNKYFIDSLAEAGGGMPEFIYPGEHIEDKVIRQFARIHQPFVTNPEIKGCDGQNIDVVPKLPARLYGSENYSFSIKFDDSMDTDTLLLSGNLQDERYEQEIKAGASGDTRLISLKWVKEKIRELEGMIGRGNQRRDQAIKKEIIDLSIKYGIISTLTSLVAVYNRKVKEANLPETIIVPVSEPRGWKMFDHPQANAQMAAPAAFVRDAIDMLSEDNCYEVPSFLRKSSSHSIAPKNIMNFMGSFIGSAPSLPKMQSESRDRSRNIPAGKEALYETIRKAAESQKADGTFGGTNDVNRKTSLFIIGMLSLEEDYKPYRIQLMKAGAALLKTGGNDSLYKTLAIYMILKAGIYKGDDMKNMLANLVEGLTEKERCVYEETISGKLDSFLGCIHLERHIGKDKDSIASLLLEQTAG